jgi:hypothetical protein
MTDATRIASSRAPDPAEIDRLAASLDAIAQTFCEPVKQGGRTPAALLPPPKRPRSIAADRIIVDRVHCLRAQAVLFYNVIYPHGWLALHEAEEFERCGDCGVAASVSTF